MRRLQPRGPLVALGDRGSAAWFPELGSTARCVQGGCPL